MANYCYSCDQSGYRCQNCSHSVCEKHGYIASGRSTHTICPPDGWFDSIADEAIWEQSIKSRHEENRWASYRKGRDEAGKIGLRTIEILEANNAASKQYYKLLKTSTSFGGRRRTTYGTPLGRGWEVKEPSYRPAKWILFPGGVVRALSHGLYPNVRGVAEGSILVEQESWRLPETPPSYEEFAKICISSLNEIYGLQYSKA